MNGNPVTRDHVDGDAIDIAAHVVRFVAALVVGWSYIGAVVFSDPVAPVVGVSAAILSSLLDVPSTARSTSPVPAVVFYSAVIAVGLVLALTYS